MVSRFFHRLAVLIFYNFHYGMVSRNITNSCQYGIVNHGLLWNIEKLYNTSVLLSYVNENSLLASNRFVELSPFPQIFQVSKVNMLDYVRNFTSANFLEHGIPRQLPELIRIYKSNTTFIGLYDNESDDIRKFTFDVFFGMKQAKSRRRIATFANVYCTNNGLIQELNNSCSTFFNGGCVFHTNIPKLPSYLQNIRYIDDKSVLSLAAPASGTYHFPMECLAALAGIPEETLRHSYILVPSKSTYIMSWLVLYLTQFNISIDNVIEDSHIIARELIVPEMGRCGQPYFDQVNWLSNTFLSLVRSQDQSDRYRHLPASSSGDTLAAPDSFDMKRKIILIKRSGSRRVSNINEVEKTLRALSKKLKYKLVVHHDGQLPPLLDQIREFSDASIVISSHGAGQLFMIFLPIHACFIDFSIENVDPWYIYARIAYMRKLNYFLLTHPHPREIDITKLTHTFWICIHLIETKFKDAGGRLPDKINFLQQVPS